MHYHLQSIKSAEITDWKQQLENAETSLTSILERLNLEKIFKADSDRKKCNIATENYPVLVTEHFLNKIIPEKLNDPLLLQVIPNISELENEDGYCADPVQDIDAIKTTNLIQKYKNRALINTTNLCSINCRFCFRRNTLKKSHKESFDKAINYIKNHPDIDEVILSGGEPLILENHEIENLITSLDNISHVNTVRIHSRILSTLPDRIDEGLIKIFSSTNLKKVFVSHINHHQEIDSPLKEKALMLKNGGFTLLNQSVLLKNINNSAATIINLSHNLFNCHILPYYLHTLDKAHGTAHFFISDDDATKIWKEAHANLPGYLVPRLVKEIPGESGKTVMI